MTDFATFKSTLADWANRQDWSDALLTSFVRDAESKFNAELRIDRMIRTADNIVTQRCASLPDDWLESDLVRIANECYPDGFAPIRYKPRDEFFSLRDTPYSGSLNQITRTSYGFYTIEGRTLYVGGPPDSVEGRQLRIDYYGEVPVFADDTPSWVYTKYPSMYRYAALMHADMHAIGEEDKAAGLLALVTDMIQKLNAAHRYARSSGSRLSRSRLRSFG